MWRAVRETVAETRSLAVGAKAPLSLYKAARDVEEDLHRDSEDEQERGCWKAISKRVDVTGCDSSGGRQEWEAGKVAATWILRDDAIGGARGQTDLQMLDSTREVKVASYDV